MSRSPEETFRIGRALGRALAAGGDRPDRLRRPPGEVLALVGDLGTGKTTFTKGIASGAGICETDRVTSPTFVIRQDYRGLREIHHYDAYRLSGARELVDIGFQEDLGSGAIIVVEWADRVRPALPAGALEVEFEHEAGAGDVSGTCHVDSLRRRITFRARRSSWADLVGRVLESAESG